VLVATPLKVEISPAQSLFFFLALSDFHVRLYTRHSGAGAGGLGSKLGSNSRRIFMSLEINRKSFEMRGVGPPPNFTGKKAYSVCLARVRISPGLPIEP